MLSRDCSSFRIDFSRGGRNQDIAIAATVDMRRFLAPIAAVVSPHGGDADPATGLAPWHVSRLLW